MIAEERLFPRLAELQVCDEAFQLQKPTDIFHRLQQEDRDEQFHER